MATIYAETVTRDEQETDVLYVAPDGAVFFTPDGEGRIWLYTDPDEQTTLMTVDEAKAETGIETVCYLDADPED